MKLLIYKNLLRNYAFCALVLIINALLTTTRARAACIDLIRSFNKEWFSLILTISLRNAFPTCQYIQVIILNKFSKIIYYFIYILRILCIWYHYQHKIHIMRHILNIILFLNLSKYNDLLLLNIHSNLHIHQFQEHIFHQHIKCIKFYYQHTISTWI